jgi:hypothetical protein
MTCAYCSEIIARSDYRFESQSPLHLECGMRMVVGSAAHQLRECTCFGGTREDPPGLSLREAARLACEMFSTLNQERQPTK